jgi:DNA-binding IclR family transcriptional regulator
MSAGRVGSVALTHAFEAIRAIVRQAKLPPSSVHRALQLAA